MTDHTRPASRADHDDLERRVVAVLHDHAETAMNQTDTESRLQAHHADTRAADRRRRVTWGISAAAAAAAVVIALVLTGVPGMSSDEAEKVAPAQERTPVQLATDFVDEFAAYDPAGASRDLASGADMKIWVDADGRSEWQRGLVWADVVGFRVLPGDCVTSQHHGSRTMLRCPFDLHAIGSDRIGRGPYHGNDFYVVVDGGEIVTTEMSIAYETNGFQDEMWAPFSEWLEREYPADFAVMIRDVDGVQLPSFTDDSISRWRTRIVSWLAVNHALDSAPSAAG